MILVIFLYIIYAAFFFINKALAVQAPPIFIIGVRFLTAGLMLLGYNAFFGKKRISITRHEWKWYLQAGILASMCSGIFLIWGIKYVSATKACLIYTCGPFLTYIYSYFIFTERMSVRKWLGLIVGFLGMLPILLFNPPAETLAGPLFLSFLSLPEIAVFGGVAFYSYGWIVVQYLVKHRSHSPVITNGISMSLAGVTALVISYLVEWPITIPNPPLFFSIIGSAIFLSNIVFYNLYATLLRHYTATFLSFASFLAPLFSAIIGWLFFREQITWHFYATTTLLSCGLTIFYLEDLKKRGLTQ